MATVEPADMAAEQSRAGEAMPGPVSPSGRVIETTVLVVGGGTVGLTLAMDLAQRNVATLVVEARCQGAVPSPKCNHISARSMEIFRRLGLARTLRDSGLPEDYPNGHLLPRQFYRPGTVAHSDPLPARLLHGQGWARYVVAHAGATAPPQPDLYRADPVRPRCLGRVLGFA